MPTNRGAKRASYVAGRLSMRLRCGRRFQQLRFRGKLSRLIASTRYRRRLCVSCFKSEATMKLVAPSACLAAALTVFCGCDASTQEFEISNFRFGKVCPYATDVDGANVRDGWVCFETDTIRITGQGRCTYAGRELPCTWYGFEFDYSGVPEGAKVSCVAKSDTPSNYGDPEAVRSEGVSEQRYEFDLPAGAGRFFNPQYSVFEATAGATIAENTVCSIDDHEVFRFNSRLVFPKQPAN